MRVLERFLALIRRRQLEAELNDELRDHLESAFEENVERGMAERDARLAARRSLGAVEPIKESYRDRREFAVIREVWQDLRFGARVFAKSPAFTAVAVLSLGLGIGANTAIFTLINALLLKTLPIEQPERTFVVTRSAINEEGMLSFPYPLYEELRDGSRTVESLLCWHDLYLSLGSENGAERVRGLAVSGNYYQTLGVRAYLGRLLTPYDDGGTGSEPVAVLSHEFWTRRFGADPAVIGSTARLNTAAFTVVGVTPPEFRGLNIEQRIDVQIPIRTAAATYGGMDRLASRTNWFLDMLGRLKPEVTLAQAEADFNRIFRPYISGTYAGRAAASEFEARRLASERLVLEPAAKGMPGRGGDFRQRLFVLMGVAGLVLLIACVNIANLLLAKAANRGPEIALRLAIGAGRGRLVRQLLTESALLAVMGSLLGLVIAYLASPLLASAMTVRRELALDTAPDIRVLGFSLAIALATGLSFGLAPALGAVRRSLAASFHASGRATTPARRRGFGRMAVAAQIALSLVLLVAAGLFLKSLENLRSLDLGFVRENIILMTMSPSASGYDEARGREFFREVLERVSALPGVVAASTSRVGTLSGSQWGGNIEVEGRENVDGEQGPLYNMVGPGYFSTLGIPILHGREIDERDGAEAPKAAVVNEAFVRHYFGNEIPLGRRLGFGGTTPEFVIVGVAKNFHYHSVRERARPVWYLPLAQHGSSGELTLQVRVAGSPGSLIPAARAEVTGVDPAVAVFNVKTMEVQVAEHLAVERMVAVLCGLFAGLASLLAAVGLYGVMAYSVAQRTSEIGVRMAIGATRRRVLGLVLGEAGWQVGVGAGAGVLAALAMARLIESFLFGVGSSDAATYGWALGLIVVVGLMAALIPARRASRIEPMVALRHE